MVREQERIAVFQIYAEEMMATDGSFNDLISTYDISTPHKRENAVREVIQEMTLFSLAQTDFFDRAAFMGGTDLRIFHGLNRFSEDLDFMLKKEDPDFSLDGYLQDISDIISSFGISFDISYVQKTNRTAIEEGIVKAKTGELHLKFFTNDIFPERIYPTQLTKVKMEVDTSPAAGATFENRFKTRPFGYMVSSCDLPTMFSGKIHAILCRPWVNRFKGRDLYDYIFYLDAKVPYNLKFLESKLSRNMDVGCGLTHDDVVRMLSDRFGEIDYKSAIDDVINFIDSEEYNSVRIWCPELFRQITEDLKPQ